MYDSKTALYCIFGNPVSHSLSPVMHNAAFKIKKINAVYLAFASESISASVDAMRTLGIKGASVTIPHKIEVMNFIDLIDPLALKISSVNTLKNEKGIISGFNTDGIGALKALQRGGFNPSGSKVLIIGNGGSARAIAFTLLDQGSDVYLTGRNFSNLKSLLADMRKHYNHADIIPPAELSKDRLDDFTAVINTTPIGMTPDTDSTPFRADFFSKRQLVFDIVYNPDETRFLREATAAGCRTVKGLDMLIYQGAEQFKIWTNEEAPLEEMIKAVNLARSSAR